jgi:hypothetical protein
MIKFFLIKEKMYLTIKRLNDIKNGILRIFQKKSGYDSII